MMLLSCEKVVLGYGSNIAVEDLSMKLEYGDYLCIVGENGSGKSTLIKGLLGLKSPIRGKITMNGLKRTEIGYLPQKTDVQKDFPASVFEVVLSGCLNSTGIFSFYTKKQKCIAMENIELFGIKQLKKRSFKELSGGQQQRVLLARAFCATKKLLLLDEPCTGLDPMVAKELYKIIKTINADKGIAVIMVSHDIKTAVSNADKILHIQKKPLFLGTTREYCQSLIGKRFLRGV